jgi:tetratricopeptide (TPR) repeat protein
MAVKQLEQLVSLLTEWAKKKLKNKEEVIELLKRFGYERPENNFESLYAHSLAALSTKHKGQLAALLRDEKVIAAFRHYWTTHEFEPFTRQFSSRLEEALKRDYVMPGFDVEAELKGFAESFRDLVRRIAAPIDQEQTALLYDVREGVKRLEVQQVHTRSRQPAPSRARPASNIPIRVPWHFLGRDDTLARLELTLSRSEGRVAITALHGLRGIGKTTLAAAYAERKRGDYRATWWIRAQTDSSMRTDLVGLGMRLGWVAADEKEEPALAAVAERLRHAGEGILLIYDNAIDAASLNPYLPRGGHAHVLVTSNAHAWRGIAEPVRLQPWAKETGADYLIARTGRDTERAAAEALSEALGGLPLAHEQAAAYCERLNVAMAEYSGRFQGAPARLMDDTRDAPAEYHDGLTVAKTFELAIEQAARLHPAAEPLIVHAALLAPEPIPLFLFSEAREKFGEQLAVALADDGLDEAVAALRAFALVDAEMVADERDPTIKTDCIRLHRLVQQVASMRLEGEAREEARRRLVTAVAAAYPVGLWAKPETWPRVRRLDPLALPLGQDPLPAGAEEQVADLFFFSGQYRNSVLGDFAAAKPLFARSLAICERAVGPEHRSVANCLNDLAAAHTFAGDHAGARPLHARALAIREKALGPEHPDTAMSLGNLADVLASLGDYAAARPLAERALVIREKAFGPEHRLTAVSLDTLGGVLYLLQEFAPARSVIERALEINQKVLGPEHPQTAIGLNALAQVRQAEGDLAEARELYERALAIREKALGPEHPTTVISVNNVAYVLAAQGDLAAARTLHERALKIREKVLGPDHPDTAIGLHNLAHVCGGQGDLTAARPLAERALAILDKTIGPAHPTYNRVRCNLAALRLAGGDAAEALALAEAALAVHEKALGSAHHWTKDSGRTAADALVALGRADEAKELRARYGIEAKA